jgi:hypothetical protein
MRVRYGPKIWAGTIVYLTALLGAWLLANEGARTWAILLLVACAGRGALGADKTAYQPLHRILLVGRA